jgi:hypothetical protein
MSDALNEFFELLTNDIERAVVSNGNGGSVLVRERAISILREAYDAGWKDGNDYAFPSESDTAPTGERGAK